MEIDEKYQMAVLVGMNMYNQTEGDLEYSILKALQWQNDNGDYAPNIIKRIVRKNSDEWREYLRHRFQAPVSDTFLWENHRWKYSFSSFDDVGEFDFIFRNNPMHLPPTEATAPQLPKEAVDGSKTNRNFTVEIDVPLLLRNHDIRADHWEATSALDNYLENYLRDNIEEILSKTGVEFKDVL